jgi:hypothetical protein
MEKPEAVTITVEILRITEYAGEPKAWYVKTTDHRGKEIKVWIPEKAVVENDCWAECDKGDMRIDHWLAVQKGIVKKKAGS